MPVKIVFNDEVKNAIEKKLPIVALESTIISHGMPYPQNIETARLLENTVRKNGAVPATIAIINGVIMVGLGDSDLEFMGTDKNIRKASRRDLPAVTALCQHAATTVSATMICAALAGIRFFATGGIGGVHRGASQSFDISADLPEFARTRVLVVSAGAKAILDIGATMEYLETSGVPVLGYKTDQIPAFYYRDSGFKVSQRVETAAEAARIFFESGEMGYTGGILVGNPVPAEAEMNKEKIESCIVQALKEADAQGVSGQAVTPFLLAKLYEITGGESLQTNIELVKSNAAVCAQIAVEYSRISAGKN